MRKFLTLLLLLASGSVCAQVDEDELGGWYMYFYDWTPGGKGWGLQGDAQYRNWDVVGDLEQLLLRSGVTYRPQSADVMFTLGVANITTGEPGPGSRTVNENRVYQEILLPQQVGPRVFLRHRFRYEQRWVDNLDFRTRWRYAIFMNIPLNQPNFNKGAVYLSFYDEIFINGETDAGDGISVERFDRNRLYGAVGYALTDRSKLQFGYMLQTSQPPNGRDSINKGQLQLSLHQSFR